MRKLMAVVLLGALGVLGTASSAIADKPGPWSDLDTGSFTAAAGTRCSFTLHGEVVSDHEQIRTLESYPDGSPKTQEIVGQLVVRYTNLDTGASVERNLTGMGIVEYGTDGSFVLRLQGGHMAVGLAPGDTDGPGFLIFTGAGHQVLFEADGSRHVTYGSGPVENICETLA